MASPEVITQLSTLESSANPQQRSEGYTRALDTILSNFSGNDLSANLTAYVESILSDSIGVIHSRPLLSAFVDKYKTIEDNEVKITAGTDIVDLLAPKIVSYEQQDTDLKFVLANAYEATEDFTNSAKTLQAIALDSAQGRTVTDDEKAAVWMRICRCYLEEDDPTNALAWLNKIKNVIFSVKNQETRLQFQLSQARINDSQRNFLDASTSYHALSNEPAIDEDERLRALSAAITTAVLAPAGPTRARQLGRIYKDDRAAETAEFSILEKIFLDRLLSPSEVAAFAANLQEHQLAKTSDGSTVLDKAVLEHNLVAASRLYQNIPLTALGSLLGVEADR
jgi:COP9 signalosome complex subunit 4